MIIYNKLCNIEWIIIRKNNVWNDKLNKIINLDTNISEINLRDFKARILTLKSGQKHFNSFPIHPELREVWLVIVFINESC